MDLFRMRLELYANIRPSYVRPGLKAMAQKMDLVMVRENLEDFYVDRNMFGDQKLSDADADADAAAAFTRAVDRLIGSPETRTRNLGGKLGTKAFADAVAKAVLDGKSK